MGASFFFSTPQDPTLLSVGTAAMVDLLVTIAGTYSTFRSAKKSAIKNIGSSQTTKESTPLLVNGNGKVIHSTNFINPDQNDISIRIREHFSLFVSQGYNYKKHVDTKVTENCPEDSLSGLRC